MTLRKIYLMELIKDGTEIFVRQGEGETFHVIAHGNWYEDHILEYMQCRMTTRFISM